MLTVLVIGIVIAVLVEEVSGQSPGGFFVPAALVISVSTGYRPLVEIALATLATVAALLCILYYRPFPLYGRRRLAHAVALGALIHAAIAITQTRAFGISHLAGLPVHHLSVGLIVPGLLADRILTDGPARVLGSAVVSTLVTISVLYALGAWPIVQ